MLSNRNEKPEEGASLPDTHLTAFYTSLNDYVAGDTFSCSIRLWQLLPISALLVGQKVIRTVVAFPKMPNSRIKSSLMKTGLKINEVLLNMDDSQTAFQRGHNLPEELRQETYRDMARKLNLPMTERILKIGCSGMKPS